MNYRKMVVVVLFPIVMCAHECISERDLRIKELEVMKYKTEDEVLNLGARLVEEQKKECAYIQNILQLWDPIHASAAEGIASFQNFVSEMYCVFDKGEDITPLINKAPFRKVPDSEREMHIACLLLVIQRSCTQRIISQCEESAEKLRILNKELTILKKNR